MSEVTCQEELAAYLGLEDEAILGWTGQGDGTGPRLVYAEVTVRVSLDALAVWRSLTIKHAMEAARVRIKKHRYEEKP